MDYPIGTMYVTYHDLNDSNQFSQEIEEISLEPCKVEFEGKNDEDEREVVRDKDDPLNTPTHSPEKAEGDNRGDREPD